MLKRNVAALGLAALLAACGGGGGDDGAAGTSSGATSAGTGTGTVNVTEEVAPVAAAIDKYIGVWISCLSNTNDSGRRVLTITKTGNLTASYSYTVATYAGANCTGTPDATDSGTGTISLTGTKVLGGAAVDKASITEAGETDLQVLVVQNSVLRIGETVDDGGTVDAEGYPNSLSADLQYARQ